LENEEDKELERIRRAKLQEMMKKSKTCEKEEKVLNKPIEVTDATFEETIQNHSLVVVDCWATWCGPCHMVAPIIEELARDYAGKVLFGKLNVDKNPATSMQYQIMSIPTLLVFNHGKLVDKIIGASPRQILEAKITRHI
jgi:thioredoxin 1